MIELGVDVNGANWSGFTPLHWTSDKTTVDLIIEAGANIEQDKDGRAPLHNAVHNPDPYSFHADIAEIVALLLKSGADETVVDNEDKTAV
ncbi:unnamed protein product, partial [Ectocarpus sp. 4 AP-2014]